MICKNCGANIEDDVKFCTNCGTKIEINNINMQSNEGSIITENNQNIEDSFDEQLVKAFIGKKADKMYHSVTTTGFNIWAFLFGIAYFSYRKMYLVSSLIIIVGEAISLIIPSLRSYFGAIVGLLFYPIYKWDMNRKIKSIKEKFPTATNEELLEMVTKKGGTSVLGMIIFLILYIVLYAIYIII